MDGCVHGKLHHSATEEGSQKAGGEVKGGLSESTLSAGDRLNTSHSQFLFDAKNSDCDNAVCYAL